MGWGLIVEGWWLGFQNLEAREGAAFQLGVGTAIFTAESKQIQTNNLGIHKGECNWIEGRADQPGVGGVGCCVVLLVRITMI